MQFPVGILLYSTVSQSDFEKRYRRKAVSHLYQDFANFLVYLQVSSTMKGPNPNLSVCVCVCTPPPPVGFPLTTQKC